MTHLSAAPPLEQSRHPVGRRTITLVDAARDERSVPVEVWYPANPSDEPPTRYDLLPGVSFEASLALHEPPVASGIRPVVLLSHGRTGMRIAYSLLCEALASRGAVVVSADHAGDTLFDWLLGTHVDDTTNEVNRVGDIRLVLDALLDGDAAVPDELTAAVDATSVLAIGHSYGAHGVIAAVAGRRGLPVESRISAIALLQPYTRLLSDAALSRVTVPELIVASSADRTTPPATDADRPWELLSARPAWRLDLHAAGHQASSDMGLYAELAHQVELPDIVRQYLEATTADSTGPGIAPYRDLLALQVRVIAAFASAAGVTGIGDGAAEVPDGAVLTMR
jgi:predicted dienelactone hydrolase